MTEKFNEVTRFIWDDFHNALTVLGADEEEEKKMKLLRGRKKLVDKTQIYCPHTNLILNFTDVLNANEKIKYKKHFYRKIPPNTPDIIILQDIKNLVMYFLTTPVSRQFINFLHHELVDRLLRALIIYFHFYLQVWEEEIIKNRAATAKKTRNPLARDTKLQKAEELKILRCIVAKEYCLFLMGSKDTAQFHHSIAGLGSDFMVSQGEKDLRIFELFLQISHRIIWIALERKHFFLIEVELDRLFRTNAYSIANRKTHNSLNQGILEEELRILHGPKIPFKRKLILNSPLVHELLNGLYNYKILTLASVLLNDEDNLKELGIKIGILGEPRDNYDITLVPLDSNDKTGGSSGRRRSSISKKADKSINIERLLLPLVTQSLEENEKFTEILSIDKALIKSGKYDRYREEARKKWIIRELNRDPTHTGKLIPMHSDGMFVATNADK